MMAKKPNQKWQGFHPSGRHPKPYSYGTASQRKLDTCHPDIKLLFNHLIQYYNITILEGWRNEETQNELYRQGRSQIKWPDGKHNHLDRNGKPESRAVDASIWHPEEPHIHWEDPRSQLYFSGIVLGAGTALGIPIRCGCDWNENLNVTDNWIDAWHFELKR